MNVLYIFASPRKRLASLSLDSAPPLILSSNTFLSKPSNRTSVARSTHTSSTRSKSAETIVLRVPARREVKSG